MARRARRDRDRLLGAGGIRPDPHPSGSEGGGRVRGARPRSRRSPRLPRPGPRSANVRRIIRRRAVLQKPAGPRRRKKGASRSGCAPLRVRLEAVRSLPHGALRDRRFTGRGPLPPGRRVSRISKPEDIESGLPARAHPAFARHRNRRGRREALLDRRFRRIGSAGVPSARSRVEPRGLRSRGTLRRGRAPLALAPFRRIRSPPGIFLFPRSRGSGRHPRLERGGFRPRGARAGLPSDQCPFRHGPRPRPRRDPGARIAREASEWPGFRAARSSTASTLSRPPPGASRTSVSTPWRATFSGWESGSRSPAIASARSAACIARSPGSSLATTRRTAGWCNRSSRRRISCPSFSSAPSSRGSLSIEWEDRWRPSTTSTSRASIGEAALPRTWKPSRARR